MKNIITGGAGFIGSHLADALGDATIFDNLSSGIGQNLHGFPLIVGDIRSADLRRVLKGHEVVWHLASNTDVAAGNRDEDLDIEVSILGTAALLSAMRVQEIPKIVYTSSFMVGEGKPETLYGAGKLGAEGLITAYGNLFGIETSIYRLTNVVGGRMCKGVIWDFIQKLKKDPSCLFVTGDGQQQRSFVLVEEALAFIVEAQSGIHNIGGIGLTTINDVARIVMEEMGIKAPIINLPNIIGDSPSLPYTPDLLCINHSDEAVRIATRRLLDE